MRQKRCKSCRQMFTPARPLQAVCGPVCAWQHAVAIKDKLAGEKAKAQRKETRAKLVAIRSYPDLNREAQAAFNAWVRRRDAGLPCIACGAEMGSDQPGGSADAGHYRSRGGAAHLRFDERNVHAQCKRCNRYLGGNVAAMRAGMVQRIGLDAVEALEADNEARKYSRDDLRAIAAHYKGK